jgi:hypothetical protein
MSRFPARSFALSLALLVGATACDPGVIDSPSDDDPAADGKSDLYSTKPGTGGTPRIGFACAVNVPAGQKLTTGYVTMTMDYTQSPGCKGSYLGSDTLYLKQPNPGKLATLVPVTSTLATSVTKGFVAGVRDDVYVVRNCPDGTPPSYVPGPGYWFDNYAGGHYECNYEAACAEGHAHACGGGSVAPHPYTCGPSWWEGTKCLGVGLLGLSTPGASELVAAIASGNVTAIIAILSTSLGQTALQAISLIPSIDSCACVGSDVVGGCSLNLSEFVRYATDLLRGQAGSFCSYGH